jgi:hypothetical protein
MVIRFGETVQRDALAGFSLDQHNLNAHSRRNPNGMPRIDPSSDHRRWGKPSALPSVH